MYNQPNVFKATNFEDFQKEINQKFLSVERENFSKNLSSHLTATKELNNSFTSYQDSKINTMAIIFAAVILFSDKDPLSLWLIGAIALMLVAIIFGFWSRKLSISSAMWWNDKTYVDFIERHWQRAEELGDDSVEFEKKTFGAHIAQLKTKNNNDALLKVTHLNADKIEKVFDISFFLSLIFLLLELLSKIKF